MKALILVLAFSQFVTSANGSQNPFVFSGVNIVDVDNGKIIPNQVVVIRNGLVESISPGPDHFQDSINSFDATGLYMIPGLFDMHTHISAFQIGEFMRDSPLYLRYGVTSILNLQGDNEILDLKKQIDTSKIDPNLFTAGWYINKPMFNTVDEVLTQLQIQNEKGFDVIKIHGDFDQEVYEALMTEVNNRNITLIGHAPRNLGIDPVIAYGQNLAHAEELLYTAFTPAESRFFQVCLGSFAFIVIIGLLTLVIRGLVIPFVSIRSIAWKWSAIFIPICLIFLILYMLTITPLTPLLINTWWVRPVLAVLLLIQLTMIIRWAIRYRKGTITILIIFGLLFCLQTILGSHTLKSTDGALRKLAKEMSEANVAISPGLVTVAWIGREQSDQERYLLQQQPDIRFISQHQKNWWSDASNQQRNFKNLFARGYTENVKLLQRFLQYFHHRGGILLPGTDAGGFLYLIPGKSLYDEMKLLVEAGINASEVLKMATINSSKFLGVSDYLGKIEQGYQADLVLLTENPLENIEAISTIQGVMLKGKWYDINTLDELLEPLAN